MHRAAEYRRKLLKDPQRSRQQTPSRSEALRSRHRARQGSS